MRKSIFGIGLIVIGLLSVLPSAAQDDAPATKWVCPEGYEGQELHVFNWTTYVAEDTISNFEALCKVTVIYDTFPTDDEMLARIRQGNPGYDIVVPSNSIVDLMKAEDLMLPLDYDNIPNFANVIERLKNPPYDPENIYTVPYQWGTTGIGYNVTKVGKEITSWYDMFQYDGPVSWLEDYRGMIGVALQLLGYDPNTENPDEIAAARDFLIENGSNVDYINQDDGQEKLATGEDDMVVEYSGDIFQIMDECECDDYAYVIPEEGALLWVDNLAIPIGAPNKALAEVFVDYILDPQVGADISNYTAYATPNQASLDQGLIDEELLTDPGIYPPEEAMQNLFFIASTPDMEQIYSNAWDEIKIRLGQ